MPTGRQAARERAEAFLELVPYRPARLGGREALAILSYPRAKGSLGTRSFVYDNALALLWLSYSGQFERARGVADTLIFLQNPEGSWGFSFGAERPADYHQSFVRSGTVAWAAHALGYFGRRYGQPRAVRAAQRGGRFLRQARLGGDHLGRGLVSAGHGFPSSAPDAPAGRLLDYAVAEHQFDAHMVFAALDEPGARRLSERIVDVLWLQEPGRFAVAVQVDQLDRGRALDAAGAWGAMWLLAQGMPEHAWRSFEYAREHFATRDAGLAGFRPYEDAVDGYDPGEAAAHIFVEGSMSMGLAAHRLGDPKTAEAMLRTGTQLSCRGQPGLPYSNTAVEGFSTRPAAAATLWFLFLDREMATGMRAPVFEDGALDSST